MNRRSPAMRYAPLVALAAIQVLIIALFPSKAEQAGGLTGFGPGAAAGAEGEQFVDPETGLPFTDAGGGAAGAGGAAGGSGGGGGARQQVSAQGIPLTGDTSHCVADRQYDPEVWAYAPKCFPKFTGSNGGKTYRGVTDKKIKIIQYSGNFGPGVEEILTAQGFNPSREQLQAMANASAKFISERYELYGRSVEIKIIEGQCQAVPPDNRCLRNEFRNLVQSEQPFAVIWGTSVSSESFDELSDLKVPNFGGWFFNDKFSVDRRPYHWDIQMGGTQVARHAADWYCKRMHGGVARYSGEQDDMRNSPRVLGVIASDDPETKQMVDEFKQFLSRCGASVGPNKEYYYAQDLSSVETQRDQAVSRMKASPKATTIMCFCELVAPIFVYNECEQQQYWPEHIVVGTGFMDADQAAQQYDNFLPPNPGSNRPGDEPFKDEQFENAFGLAQADQQLNVNNNSSAKVYKMSNPQATGAPYGSAELDWSYAAMIANMIQFAGPNLNPENLERGAFAMGVLDPGGSRDPKLSRRSFRPGDYTWVDNMREVYWSTTQRSDFNGRPGRYVTLNGGRWFMPGEYPSGQIELPPKPR